MCSTIFQVLCMILMVSGALRKRSPLELGLVRFPAKPQSVTNVTIPIPAIIKSAHGHKWVPGHVQHHSYIPGHVDHVFIPAHALLLEHTVQAVLVHPAVLHVPAVNHFRRHFGGFGVGVDKGGPGAGHGYHVSVLHF